MSLGAGKLCSRCGLPIPDSELGSRCPNCLLELAITPLTDEAEVSPAPSADVPVQSRFFGNYEILGEVARGGMGVVYRARQLGLQRTLALKLIQSGLLTSPEALLRFQIEIQAVAQLNHPNIVSLYETGEHDGQHYFTMALVEGGHLGEFNAAATARGSEWLRRAAGLLVKIAGAIHHAHLRGVLHRDLKPSNILLDETGEPHITDFGLAKILERDSGLTHTQSIVGSPNYMAPEQASGRSHEVTTSADIYSLGAILYELLAGRPPFQAGTALETMRLAVDKEPPSPRKLNPQIDADLETICLKCLRKEPQARYGSADELAQDLRAWLDGLPIRARPVGALGGVWRWSRRHPATALLSFGLLLALVGIAVGSVIAVVRVTRAEHRAIASLRESLLNQTRTLRLSSVLGNRSESLQYIRQAAALGGSPQFRHHLRSELLATLARTDLSFASQPQLPCSADARLNLLAPRFDRWATVTNARTVIILNVADGRELKRFDVGASLVALQQFSHDGRYLGLRHADSLAIWDVDSGEVCFRTNDTACVFCFLPDSSGVLVQVDRKVAVVLALPSLQVRRRIEPHEGKEPAPRVRWSILTLSPNGQTLAAQPRGSRLIELIDFQSGGLKCRLTNSGVIHAICWSPDGMRLGVATHQTQVAVWNVGLQTKIYETGWFGAIPRNLAFGDNGSLLAAGCDDHMLRLFDVEAARLVSEFPCDTYRLAFDESGLRMGPVFRDRVPGLLDLKRPGEFIEATVADASIELRSLQASRDGRIAAAGSGTNVILCDPRTGRTVMHRVGWSRATACFDPQGPYLLSAGPQGLFRWKMLWPDNGDVSLVEEEKLLPDPGWVSFAFSATGDVLVGAHYRSNMAVVFDRTCTSKLAQLGPHPAVEFAALSPDASWVATASFSDVRIWDTKSARQVQAWAIGSRPRAAFSPDGKWFAAFGTILELREVGSWKLRPLPSESGYYAMRSAAAFSHDGRVLAVVTQRGGVELIDLLHFKSLGLLQGPAYVPLNALAFTPDGRLIAVGDAARFRVWNLVELRRRLAEHRLDWDLPPETRVAAHP
jgi:eukaryotic-like serine/threonine-protein kinase